MIQDEARDHLAIIREVVDRARTEQMASGDIYVGWGVVLVLCIALTLAGDAVDWHWGWVSFPVLGTITAVWTGVTARNRGLRRDTYGGRIEGTLWIAVGSGISILLAGGLGSDVLPLAAVIPSISVLVGVALLTSAAIYTQPMLRWSGVGFLLLAGPCFWLSWQTQYALFGVAMLFGYVVPGLMALRQEKRR